MTLGLFYDTETTGLPNKHKMDDHPSQPHLVQLAAHLVDMKSHDVIQSMDLIVHPTSWQIPDEVADIHGITTDYAQKVGLPEQEVLNIFTQLWQRSKVRIAHNEEFDAKIIRFACMRYLGMPYADTWRRGEAKCTSEMTIDIMNLPASDRMKQFNIPGPKKPRLEEAYKHFTSKTLRNAHSAIADVNGCMEVYWAVQDLKSTGARGKNASLPA